MTNLLMYGAYYSLSQKVDSKMEIFIKGWDT